MQFVIYNPLVNTLMVFTRGPDTYSPLVMVSQSGHTAS